MSTYSRDTVAAEGIFEAFAENEATPLMIFGVKLRAKHLVEYHVVVAPLPASLMRSLLREVRDYCVNKLQDLPEGE
jgi:hypothetical protein